MKLLITSNTGDFFEHTCDEYSGYDIFCLARDQFGGNWETYTVSTNGTVLENVLNPTVLDWDNPQTLQ